MTEAAPRRIARTVSPASTGRLMLITVGRWPGYVSGPRFTRYLYDSHGGGHHRWRRGQHPGRQARNAARAAPTSPTYLPSFAASRTEVPPVRRRAERVGSASCARPRLRARQAESPVRADTGRHQPDGLARNTSSDGISRYLSIQASTRICALKTSGREPRGFESRALRSQHVTYRSGWSRGRAALWW